MNEIAGHRNTVRTNGGKASSGNGLTTTARAGVIPPFVYKIIIFPPVYFDSDHRSRSSRRQSALRAWKLDLNK